MPLVGIASSRRHGAPRRRPRILRARRAREKKSCRLTKKTLTQYFAKLTFGARKEVTSAMATKKAAKSSKKTTKKTTKKGKK
jgi:hypothetical protein